MVVTLRGFDEAVTYGLRAVGKECMVLKTVSLMADQVMILQKQGVKAAILSGHAGRQGTASYGQRVAQL